MTNGLATEPPAPAHGRAGYLLITYAWAMEIVGVGCGIINAGYTTFGTNLPTTLWGYVPAAPMVVLAVAELGRVPLASAIFHKRIRVQFAAGLAILALSYLAVENWTIGFERLFSMRVNEVITAMAAVSKAEADKASLDNDGAESALGNKEKREELRAGIKSREDGVASLTNELNAAGKTHQDNLTRIGEECRVVAGPCIKPRSDREDGRYDAEADRLNASIAAEAKERDDLQTEIDGLVQSDAGAGALAARNKAAAESELEAKRDALRQVSDNNSIYRLAASWFGASSLTAEQFARVRWWFATVSAVAVALTGSVAALVHYSPDRSAGAPSFADLQMVKLARARRAYYARKRKPLVRKVAGPEVTKYRDRYVVLPQRDAGFANLMNSLFWGRGRVGDESGANPKVVSIDKDKKVF